MCGHTDDISIKAVLQTVVTRRLVAGGRENFLDKVFILIST